MKRKNIFVLTAGSRYVFNACAHNSFGGWDDERLGGQYAADGRGKTAWATVRLR